MFQRLRDAPQHAVRLTVDGARVEAMQGDSVAAALLAAGVSPIRVSAVSGSHRAPYCMMGVCFECLVTIDGVGNRQGCMVPVRDGMRIETQKARREAGR
jgi:sarcosine oxidase subunit alpha